MIHEVSGSVATTTYAADPSASIAAALLDLGEVQSVNARQRANQLSFDRHLALTHARQALRDAQKARDEGGFFQKWGDELQAAAVVASVAASVATCGAGAPAAVVVLTLVAAGCSAGSYAMKKTGADGKLCTLEIGGKKLTINWSDAVALAGVAAGGGAAIASASSSGAAATKGATTAGQTAGSSASASSLQEACRVVHHAGVGAQVGTSGGRAYCTVRAGMANSEATQKDADATEANAQVATSDAETKDLIDELETSRQLRSKIVELVSAIVESKDASMNAIWARRS